MIVFQKAWARSCKVSMWMALSVRGPTVSKAKELKDDAISVLAHCGFRRFVEQLSLLTLPTRRRVPLDKTFPGRKI